jgi:FkbM family methyltransferase
MVDSCQIKKLDEYFNDIFGTKSDGYFIEVGAYDGISFSNTIPLVKNNWNGIYIEPVNEYFNRLQKNLGMFDKLVLLNCAISNEEGDKYINIMNTLSSLNDEIIDIYNKIDWAKPSTLDVKKQKVECKTLTNILNTYNVPLNFDLLVIDVEGYELNVLKSLDFQKYRPKCIIIELEENHESFQTNNCISFRQNIIECRKILEDNNYYIYYKDNWNSIYVTK